MKTADLVDRFDPDDDLVALLRASDTVIAHEKKRMTKPMPKPVPGLEQISQQIVRRMESSVAAKQDAVGRGGGRGGGRGFGPGPRPGPRFGPGWRGRGWRGPGWGSPGSDWPPPWCPWNEEDAASWESYAAEEGAANRVGRAGSRALASEPKGLLNVFDPRHNLREMAKELVLLEDHLAQPAKHCPDCIRKHLLKTEALAEEAVQLDTNGSMRDRLVPLPGQIRNLQRAFLADTDRNALQQKVRELRKVLSKESFDVLSFKPSVQTSSEDTGSPNRTPVVFAMERGKDRMGSEKEKSLSPLPSTVVAALRRRVEAGLSEENPAPLFFRTRNKDGSTTVTEARATGTQGDGMLVVTTVEKVPRTLVVPMSDAVLDLSADDTFQTIPWPAILPVTRKEGIEELSIEPGKKTWQNIRVIASVLWPVVDAFVLKYAGTNDEARKGMLRRLLVAAIVNAAYESSLDATLEGDKGKAVGLFQLREDGAGIGMSKDDRKDAFLNTARIGQRMIEVRKFFAPVAETEAKIPGSTPPATWTALFARYVEAPEAKDEAERVRGDTAAAAFPRGMPVVVREQPTAVEVPSEKDLSVLSWVLGGVALTTVVVGIGAAVIQRRK